MIHWIVGIIFLLATTSGVLPVEQRIADSSVECAAGWDIAGSPIFEFCSDNQREIALTNEQRRAIVGGVLTHNHPTDGCWTLSQFDLDVAVMLHLRQIRAVSWQGDYVRVAIFSYATAIPIETINTEARYQLLKLRSDSDTCDYLDAAWRALSERYGFEYRVEAMWKTH